MLAFIPISLLSLMAWQDIRQRAVSFWLLFAFTLFTLWLGFDLDMISLHSTLVNVLMLSVMLAVLWMYYKFRYGWKTRIVNQKIGLADLVLFILFAFYFSTINYLLFLNLSLLLAFASYLFKNKRTEYIPLATYLSVGYFLAMLYHGIVYGFNYRFHTDWISLI